MAAPLSLCLSHTLICAPTTSAGKPDEVELAPEEESQIVSLLRLASASLLPIPRAGYDFFTGVVRRVFGEPAALAAAGLPRLEGGGRVAGSKGVYWESPSQQAGQACGPCALFP